MEPTGFICMARIYEFNGWKFEYGYTGCWPLKKNGEPRAKAGKTFFKAVNDFFKLSDDEKEKHRIGGGCIEI